MSEFTALLDSYPEGWRPQAGDKLIGVVIGIEERTGDYEPYPIVTIRTDGGSDFAFHAYHTVARREVEKLEPKVGDRIGVDYHGLHPERNYERYRIVLQRGVSLPLATAPEDATPPDEPTTTLSFEPNPTDDIPF